MSINARWRTPMRLVFSFVGILLAVVIVLLLARNQLSATRGLVEKTTSTTAPAGGATRGPGATDASGAPATANVREASQQAQRNVANQVNEALQKGVDARAGAADK
jgi:hypothetical protein